MTMEGLLASDGLRLRAVAVRYAHTEPAAVHLLGVNDMAREWNDLQETEIDIDETALFNAIKERVSKTTQAASFVAPGDDGAVANYDGHNYDTWYDLAYAFVMDITEFTK